MTAGNEIFSDAQIHNFFFNETFSIKNNLENIVYEKITVHTKTLVTGAGTEIVGNSVYDQTSIVEHNQ